MGMERMSATRLLYPKLVPLSVNTILLLPMPETLDTICHFSWGKKLSLFRFTILPVLAAATTMSV